MDKLCDTCPGCRKLPSLVLLILIWTMLTSLGWAQDVEVVPVPPAAPVRPGAVVPIRLLFLNGSAVVTAVRVPPTISVILQGGTQALEVSLPRRGGPAEETVDIEPQAFASASYELQVPPWPDTLLRLEMEGLGASPLVLLVADTPPETSPPMAAGSEPWAEERLGAFGDNFSGYQPLYFLYGTDPSNAKFQLSFKYRLFNAEGPLAQRWGWIKDVHFAYTQTSFWDLESDSKPFEDTSYKPELLLFHEGLASFGPGRNFRLDLQGGLQHESNGRAGDASRSLNVAYLWPWLTWDGWPPGRLVFAPRVWAYLGDLGDNPDIADYQGYFDLQLRYTYADALQLGITYGQGTQTGKYRLTLDGSYPLTEVCWGNLAFYLYAQYFQGYGESLLRYDEWDSALRVGVGFYR